MEGLIFLDSGVISRSQGRTHKVQLYLFILGSTRRAVNLGAFTVPNIF